MCIGDCKARNSEGWNGDSADLPDTKLTAHFCMNEVINGPTHILFNSLSFIDSIFITETS